MAAIEQGSFLATLELLFKKGHRYATLIDVGAADGSLALDLLLANILPDCVPLNIDANPIYEDSLQRVKAAFGGDYRIAAASDTKGEIEFTQSVHPYWSSPRPPGDEYWERVQHQSAGTIKVPALRIDDLVTELQLESPYLIRLDVQGGEVQALRGATNTLTQTDIVVCEADIDDFQAINRELLASGFDLFDLTLLSRGVDSSLAWFYPVYTSARLRHLRDRSVWLPEQNEQVLAAQAIRRESILKRHALMLPGIPNLIRQRREKANKPR